MFLLISKSFWLNHPCEQLYCEHMLLPFINVIRSITYSLHPPFVSFGVDEWMDKQTNGFNQGNHRSENIWLEFGEWHGERNVEKIREQEKAMIKMS